MPRSLKMVLVALAALVVVWVIVNTSYWYFVEDYRKFKSVQVGMGENEVIELLGEPTLDYSKEDAPDDYYVKGYAFKRKEITNKVFIYIGQEPIAYVYFDNANRVEDVYVGGS